MRIAKLLLWLSLLSAVFVVRLSEAADDELRAKDVLDETLKYRTERLRSGNVELSIENYSAGNKESEFKHIFYFTSDDLRYDRTGRTANGVWGSTSRFISSKGVVIRDVLPRRDLTVTIDPQPPFRRDTETISYHPRDLGVSYVDTSVLKRLGPKNLFASLAALDSSVEEIVYRDQQVYKLSFEDGKNATVTFWVSPDQGYNPLRIECRFRGDEMLQATDVVLKQYPPSGIWYPERTTSITLHNSAELSRQVVTVKHASFDIEIDPKLFTLAGLELTPGRPISDRTTENFGSQTWDGEKLVSDDPARKIDLADNSASTTKHSLLLILNAALCVALAAFLIYRRLRLRGVP